MVKRFFGLASGVFPFRLLNSMVKPKVVAPFYHIVSSTTPNHLKSLYNVISPKQFVSDLDFLLKHFSPIHAIDIPLVLKGEKRFPKPPLFLSFDDGFSEISSVVAPILIKKGVPATFFVCPNFIGNRDILLKFKANLIWQAVDSDTKFKDLQNYLMLERKVAINSRHDLKTHLFNLSFKESFSIEQVANIVGFNIYEYLTKNRPYLNRDELIALADKGFVIGAHSLNHPLFSELSLQEQIDEVIGSVNWIQSKVPNQPKLFAFPFTDFGVEPSFFQYFFVQHPDLVDLMFGTAGYKPSSSDRFLHRIPMETQAATAKRIIKGEFFYYLAKSIVGKHKVDLSI